MKPIVHFILFIALFFLLWLGLSRINWMQLFHIQEKSTELESKLSGVIWDAYSEGAQEIHGTPANANLSKLVNHLCSTNQIDTTKIKVHLFKNDAINAFTLPGGHLVVYTGLIHATDNESELAAVVAHELGHYKKNHVMKRMVKEVGLSLLVNISAGKSGAPVVQKLVSMLTSSSYDQSMEKEADLMAVDFMLKAHFNPNAAADFMYKLSADESIPQQLQWISTHPESKERAKYILDYIGNKKIDAMPFFKKEEWDALKNQ